MMQMHIYRDLKLFAITAPHFLLLTEIVSVLTGQNYLSKNMATHKTRNHSTTELKLPSILVSV